MTDAPFRRQFDAARDPYAARNALGITDTGGSGGGAPTDAQYIVAVDDPTLTNDRVLTNTATVTWDFSTAGQAKANAATGGGGNVSNSGTPTSGQYAKWVTATTIQGVAPATVLSDIGAQPAGSYQPLDADLTAIAALTGTNTIYYRSAADTWSPVVVSTGLAFSGGNLTATGGGGTPGGSNTQVQFNDSSAFGGDADLIWNKTTNLLTVNGNISITGGVGNSLAANSAIQGSLFRCLGTVAIFGSELTGGVVNLRPNGSASTTGQFQVTTIGVTATTPITLPADPTTSLQAATKQYVDARITPTYPPQGRLTLQTATPVMTTTQSAKTTLFYTPYVGNKVPIYDGTTMAMMTFAELSNVTTASSVGSAGPAAVAASSVYDLFVWSNAGTSTLTRGPAWTNDTTRSAGTALVMVNGILLNNASITNGPAAQRGTYVGTTRSNASSTLDWIFGALAANGTAGFLMLWNAYNRVLHASQTRDNTDSWSVANANWHAANGSNSMRCSIVRGLDEDMVFAQYTCTFSINTNNAAIGVALDSAATAHGITGAVLSGTTMYTTPTATYTGLPGIGFHFLQATELSAATATFLGDGGVGYIQNGLSTLFMA